MLLFKLMRQSAMVTFSHIILSIKKVMCCFKKLYALIFPFWGSLCLMYFLVRCQSVIYLSTVFRPYIVCPSYVCNLTIIYLSSAGHSSAGHPSIICVSYVCYSSVIYLSSICHLSAVSLTSVCNLSLSICHLHVIFLSPVCHWNLKPLH